MEHKLIASMIVDSFKNEYDMDVHFNNKLNNKYMSFRPYAKKINNLGVFLLENFFSFFILIFSFFIPIFSYKIIRLCGKGKTDKVKFVSSIKARNIFENLKNDYFSSSVSFSDDDEKSKIKFNFSNYITYMYCILFFISKYGLSPWFYRSMILIPEMIVFISHLKEVKAKDIAMTNQLDRWAFLISSYSKLNGCKLYLYQHGTVISDFKPKLKLPIVSHLYCYNLGEKNFFEKNIVELLCDIHILKPKIKLTNVNKDRTLLIIGSGSSEHFSLESEAVKFLIDNKPFYIYLKPHPKFLNDRRYSDSENDKMLIINDNFFFPDVDVVIHFGSTLAIEYINSKSSVKVLELGHGSSIIKQLINL